MPKGQKTAAGNTYDPKEARAQAAAVAAKRNEIYVRGEAEATGTFMNIPAHQTTGPDPYFYYACLRNHPPHLELINELVSWGFKEPEREWNVYRVGDQDPGKYIYLGAPLSTKRKRRQRVLEANKHANRNMSKDFGPHLHDLSGIVGHGGDVKIDTAIVQG